MQENRKMWDEYVAINPHSQLYDLDSFRQGANKLNPLLNAPRWET